MSKLALSLALLSISASLALADAKLTVSVLGDDGPVQGTVVTARAYIWDFARSTYYYQTVTGFTNAEGEACLMFRGNLRFDSSEESTISVGSGIFSREVREQVRLDGWEDRESIRR